MIEPTHNRDSGLVDAVQSAAHPLNGSREDFNPLMELIGEARFVLLGATTYHGTVTAASNWGALAERKYVRPALSGSYELAFHDTAVARFMLILHERDAVMERLRVPRLERAIGVIYRPDTERQSHYFNARLADQFDAVLHFDETQALEPLEYGAEWKEGEAPETFPFAA